MEVNRSENIKQPQISKKLNQQYNKKKDKKGEKELSFSDILKALTQ